MKKALAGTLLGVALLFPSFSHAQTATSTPVYSAEVQAQIDYLQQIIALLLQIQALQAQLADNQAATHADVQTIKTQTAPTGSSQDNVVAAPSFRVFTVEYEPKDSDGKFGDLYYWGTDQLAVSSTHISKDGEQLPITFTSSWNKPMGSSCNGSVGGGECGGYAYRLYPSTALENGKYTVTVTNQNAESATQSISI